MHEKASVVKKKKTHKAFPTARFVVTLKTSVAVWRGGPSVSEAKKIEFVFTRLSLTGAGSWTGGVVFLALRLDGVKARGLLR